MTTISHILITGCSSGIGYHCAKTLHQHDYRVVASCRRKEDTLRLREQGLNAVTLDLACSDSIEQGYAQALEQLGGRIDALFNNGAYGQTGALEDLSTNALRAQFENNFFGWHHLIRLVLPLMLNQQRGRIIQNSSVLGLAALRYRGAYCASKFALEGYTDTLRLELSDTPIKVCLIEPGPINSRFRANAKQVFLNTIAWQTSRHRDNYQATLTRLGSDQPPSRHTLEPDAIADCLLDALRSATPKTRYYVTRPTKLVAIARRILSTKALDRLLLKGGA
ncbi:SDR family NAD(P)-dependent oxidoreductase [Celerinatantimonas yamalensis]|uniref:SDR family NAD(P)-dependent oxidoreductase n=2 Tax=Celerinatantimonas yamalensis TaxID=559956 RepID=A0ABW9G270_9GAMM